jgi:ribosome-binding protein aMBF1 (putative translation factor)
MYCGREVMAGRSMLRWSRERLAAEAGLAVSTVRKVELANGIPPCMAETLIAIEQTLARHGVKLMPGGVTREHVAA